MAGESSTSSKVADDPISIVEPEQMSEDVTPEWVSSRGGRDPPSFKVTVDSIMPMVHEVIAKSKAELNDVASAEKYTFEHVVAIAESSGSLDPLGLLTFLGQVSDSKELRDTINEAYEIISAYEVEMSMREDLYTVVQSVADSRPELDEQQQRMLDRILRDLIRNGLSLSKDARDEVQALQQQSSSIANTFEKNLAEDTEGVWFRLDELDGVPTDLVQTWERRTLDGIEEVKMTFKYPDVGPTIRLAKLESTRKKAWLANDNRVLHNAELLAEIVNIRNQIKSLLKFETFAAYVLQPKMAKDVQTVTKFLDNLRTKAMPLAMQELTALQSFKNELTNSSAPIKEWDKAWVTSSLLRQRYKYDTDIIAEYFELDHTIEKMLGIYERLFSLEFLELTKPHELYKTWHDDVRQFSVGRTDTGQHLGWLYMDMFPRTGKYGHAANWVFRTKRVDSNGKELTTASALVCNFSKPTKVKPSLLKHREVETLFHELGHGIHGLLIDAGSYYFGNLGAVEQDFIEAPSQMLENWCSSSSVLKDMSRHYATGEPLSDAQIDSIQKVQRVGRASGALRNVALSLFDMRLHTDYRGTTVEDLSNLWTSLMHEVGLQEIEGALSMGYTAFSHIVSGYEAGYYSYLWAEVFSADMYHTKFLNHETDAEVGGQYRDIVLKPGGSRDALKYLTEFLGRPPTSEAFLRDLGLE